MLTESEFGAVFDFIVGGILSIIIFIALLSATISGLSVYGVMKYKESIKNEQIETDSRKVDFRKQDDGIATERQQENY